MIVDEDVEIVPDQELHKPCSSGEVEEAADTAHRWSSVKKSSLLAPFHQHGI